VHSVLFHQPIFWGNVGFAFYRTDALPVRRSKCWRKLDVFLQIRKNWKRSGNLCDLGKVRGKYYFWNVGEKSGKM